jgi:hypothetical protein
MIVGAQPDDQPLAIPVQLLVVESGMAQSSPTVMALMTSEWGNRGSLCRVGVD